MMKRTAAVTKLLAERFEQDAVHLPIVIEIQAAAVIMTSPSS